MMEKTCGKVSFEPEMDCPIFHLPEHRNDGKPAGSLFDKKSLSYSL